MLPGVVEEHVVLKGSFFNSFSLVLETSFMSSMPSPVRYLQVRSAYEQIQVNFKEDRSVPLIVTIPLLMSTRLVFQSKCARQKPIRMPSKFAAG